MTEFLRNIPETLKGILLLAFGSILLLHTAGILTKQLDLFIVGAAFVMCAYGFVILNGPKKVAALIKGDFNSTKPE